MLYGIEYIVKFKNDVDWYDIVPDVMKQSKHFINFIKSPIKELVVVELNYANQNRVQKFSETVRNNEYFSEERQMFGYKQHKIDTAPINMLLNQEEKQESRLTENEKKAVDAILNHPLAVDSIEFSGWDVRSVFI